MVTRRELELHLPETRRKEIFLALVDAQDQGMTVAKSRRTVTERFGVSDRRLRQIEREGLDLEWPPL
jgi:crotonobetainyl-CoA:carnitine CoA-transferase CaiB-like acyl-CoA transferase